MNNVQKAQAWLDENFIDIIDVIKPIQDAHEIIAALLAEREEFINLLLSMLESDTLMGRITDEQIQKAIQLCEESK